MATQGNLIIGRNLTAETETTTMEMARQIYEQLGVKIDAATIEELNDNQPNITKTIWYQGKEFTVPVELRVGEYGEVVIGIWLTSRYRGAILDAHSPNGLEQPAEFVLADFAAIWMQVRNWWFDAKFVLWTEHY